MLFIFSYIQERKEKKFNINIEEINKHIVDNQKISILSVMNQKLSHKLDNMDFIEKIGSLHSPTNKWTNNRAWSFPNPELRLSIEVCKEYMWYILP